MERRGGFDGNKYQNSRRWPITKANNYFKNPTFVRVDERRGGYITEHYNVVLAVVKQFYL